MNNVKLMGCVFAIVAACGWMHPVTTQATPWDAELSNTSWYVPAPSLVAYTALNPNSLTTPPPVLTGDQTLWSIGPVSNGAFTGTSKATLAMISSTSDGQPSSSSYSQASMYGQIFPSGAVRITFADQSTGDTTLGVGQVQPIGNTLSLEMQMITGADVRVTHWAYMARYDPATRTPPAASEVSTAYETSPQWSWTAHTVWSMRSPAMFGSAEPGTFIVTHYGNGYILGEGVGPAGNATQHFTQLGSITPEGSVLFNVLGSGTLSSYLGAIKGNASGATISLSGYGFSGNDYSNTAHLSLAGSYDLMAARNMPPLQLSPLDAQAEH